MKDPGPQHGADRAGQHPRQKHDRTQCGYAVEVPLQEERRGGSGDDNKRRRKQREQQRVLERHAEVFAGDDVPVIVEADPILVGEEQHHLMQARPQGVGDRKDRKGCDRHEHRQDP
jgi:hypothetical protein